MICDQCNAQPATVFLTQIINGETTKRSLCESCGAPILAQIPPLQQLLERPADCPTRVSVTDPISVHNLATVLHVQFYHIVAVLMQHNIYKSAHDDLDFPTASLVCKHYGATPHKVD